MCYLQTANHALMNQWQTTWKPERAALLGRSQARRKHQAITSVCHGLRRVCGIHASHVATLTCREVSTMNEKRSEA